MVENLEIITVNYNTPDLVDRLVKSVIEIEGNYPIHIIDGSDRQVYKDELTQAMLKHGVINPNIRITQFSKNIHHGRGMNFGVSDSEYEWVLILDSDNFIIQPCIEKVVQTLIETDKKLCGYHCWVDVGGRSQGRNQTDTGEILYYHPSFLLINRNFYMELKAKNITFIHHGAPCLKIMQYLHYNGLSKTVGITLADVFGIHPKEYGQLVNLESRGTVSRFGYNL